MANRQGPNTRPTALRSHKRAALNLNREDPLYVEAQSPTALLGPENLPPPPKSFNARHVKHYKEFARRMRDYRILTEKQISVLTQCAWLAAEVEELQEHIAKHGHFVTHRLGGRTQSPESKACLQFQKMFLTALTDIGMTPVGASKIKPSRVADVPKVLADVSGNNPLVTAGNGFEEFKR